MEKINPIKRKINMLYYYLFRERFSKKIDFKFDDVYRWDLIDHLNNKYNFSTYLEIGCNDDELFSRITIKNKIGIDPVIGGNMKITSDNFFLQNKIMFDCVFIDGLHVYDQVKKDILNSSKFLNQNGFILVHDCLPRSLSRQAVPRYRLTWNGDVWKAIVDLRRNPELEIFTCLADEGISIIQNKKNSNILNLDKKISNLKFKDFYYNHKEYMRIINFEEFKNKY
tara:strand:+ start:5776 stop:6450 length:675 start_codon:yes stop_codon:yes gene_type:complete